MTRGVSVIVLAKAPVPGFAKTRLIPALGAEGAASLAERLLDHAVKQAANAALGPVELCCTPDMMHPAFRRHAAARVELTLQTGPDLGARMHGALAPRLASGEGCLLIGTDAPDLTSEVLREAAAALARSDAVFVPAFDGGYALVGLKRPEPRLFGDMEWSTDRVMDETRRRGRALGLTLRELSPVGDIDEPSDLARLPESLRP